MDSNSALVQQLQREGVLNTPVVIDAFTHIDRKDFVCPQDENVAYEDRPLPIGHGQTISQPHTVAFMLEHLEPRSGQGILDIGSGSGWTTALLGHIVGKGGKVIGTEIVPELVAMGQEHLLKYPQLHTQIQKTETTLGYPKEAPYDRILVSAGDTEIPKALLEQLKVGGIMMIPIENAVWKIVKTAETNYETEIFEGFLFVPLIR